FQLEFNLADGDRRRLHSLHLRDQSSSASRRTAGASGFFIFSQSRERQWPFQLHRCLQTSC
ncbi:MAG: hypothetical protein WAO16_26925, partial [Pseudolabrys sp.]